MASPRRTSTLPNPAARADQRAFSAFASVMSMPMARPRGPTLLAASSRSMPAPQPMSPYCLARRLQDSTSTRAARSTSSSVVPRPSVNRTEPRASAGATPMARMIAEALTWPS
jgi:hypothetical protein